MPEFDRRQFLRVCAGLGTMTLSGRPASASEKSPGRIEFRLVETAGLRRFGYPASAILPARASDPGLGYRLTRDGKEVPSQFRRLDSDSGRPEVVLDFTTSPGPFETERFAVEFGPALEARAEPGRGLIAERGTGIFRVSNPPFLTYEIPDDLAGFASSIRTPQLEFLTPHSPGLFLVDRGTPTRIPLKFARDPNASIAGWTRRGPIAVRLRFDGMVAGAKGMRFRTIVDLTFVNSKSWIETNVTVEDPGDRIDFLGIDLGMKLEGKTALVDCGASSTVYSHLRDGETLTFTGLPPSIADERRPRWMIEQGAGSDRKPFAIADSVDHPPEGWIHLMDHARCSALSIADFAAASTDRFLVGSNGRIEFSRQFSRRSAPTKSNDRKSLKFWLHVVPMPVQIGAVTSPQAMLSPLRLEWGG